MAGLLAVPGRVHRSAATPSHYAAVDAFGNQVYAVTSTPDLRRVPGNVAPLHLRLSNKDVAAPARRRRRHRQSMLVDWVGVEVKYP